jgi:hypothetical protein
MTARFATSSLTSAASGTLQRGWAALADNASYAGYPESDVIGEARNVSRRNNPVLVRWIQDSGEPLCGKPCLSINRLNEESHTSDRQEAKR